MPEPVDPGRELQLWRELIEQRSAEIVGQLDRAIAIANRVVLQVRTPNEPAALPKDSLNRCFKQLQQFWLPMTLVLAAIFVWLYRPTGERRFEKFDSTFDYAFDTKTGQVCKARPSSIGPYPSCLDLAKQ